MNASAERILKIVKQASPLLRATTGRRGMVVHLPTDARDLLVAGDLHGNLANFKRILEWADLERCQDRHLVLQEFIHGPGRYPGGGCQSHRLLDAVCALKCQYPSRVHLILGNHELSQWTGRSVAKDSQAMNELFESGVREAYGDHADDFLSAYDDLFASMLLAVRTPHRVMVCHSIPEGRHLATFDPAVFDCYGLGEDQVGKGSSAYQLVWGRDVREETARQFCDLMEVDFVITGHIAQESGYSMPNRRQIILDSMATPAACLLVPADRPITAEDLLEGIRILPR